MTDLFGRPLLDIDGYTEPENSLAPKLILSAETMVPRRDTPFSPDSQEETVPIQNHQTVKATIHIEDLTVALAKSFLVTDPVQEPPKPRRSVFGISNTIARRIPGPGVSSFQVHRGNFSRLMRNIDTSPTSPFRNLNAVSPAPWRNNPLPHIPSGPQSVTTNCQPSPSSTTSPIPTQIPPPT